MCFTLLVGAKGGETTMGENRGMNSWILIVYASYAGSLQAGFLEGDVHATNPNRGLNSICILESPKPKEFLTDCFKK